MYTSVVEMSGLRSIKKLLVGCHFMIWTLLIATGAAPVVSKKSVSNLVTIGSVIKLKNRAYNDHLYSQDLKYGSGSAQQCVTGVRERVEGNSYWQVRSGTNTFLSRGTPVLCGQKIRLTHLNTGASLHSHHYQPPSSRNGFEVSCLDGPDDHLDDWVVVCPGLHWRCNEFVKFQHVHLGLFLQESAIVFGDPVPGQREVITWENGQSAQWKAEDGVYLKPSEGGNK